METMELLTLKEAAERLRVSLRTAYRFFHDGILEGPRYQPYRVYESSVQALLATPHRQPTPTPRPAGRRKTSGAGEEFRFFKKPA